jgi:hypothetical protein
VIVKRLGDGLVVAAGKQLFDPLQECRVDRDDVRERAVRRARFLHEDLAVALDDLRLDLADMACRDLVKIDVSGENARARFAHARRTQRVGRARPAESR